MGDGTAEGLDLLDRIGGTRVVVHRAVRRGSGRVVVVKRAPWAAPDAAAALGREAAVLGRVRHRHLPRLLEVVDDATGRTVVLAHAPGGSLLDRLRRAGPLAPAEAAAVGAALAEALAALHTAGVVHRDVHPGNVLFDAELVPLLADLDHALDDAGAPVPWDGVPVGHPAHVHPAVAAGGTADATADLHALATTVWTAATGAPPPRSAPTEPVQLPRHTAVAPELDACLRACLDGTIGDASAAAAAFHVLSLDASRATAGPDARPTRATAGQLSVGASRTAAVLGGGADALAGATRHFGPARGRAVEASRAPTRRSRHVPVATLAAGAGVVAVALALVPFVSAGEDAVVPASTAPPPACDGTRPGEDGVGSAQQLLADLDGDGCSELLRWGDGVLHTPTGSYRLGRPGDELLVGDWDGDGRWSPALHRPASGEVFEFEPAPASGAWRSRPAWRTDPGGTAHRADTDRDGRHEVVVTPTPQPGASSAASATEG